MSSILIKLFLITLSLLSVLGAPATLDKRGGIGYGGCPKGYGYSSDSSVICTICSIGTASSGQFLPCHTCATNTFSSRRGASGCTTCSNTYTWIQYVGQQAQGIGCSSNPQIPLPKPQ